jgi:hypothetical protein
MQKNKTEGLCLLFLWVEIYGFPDEVSIFDNTCIIIGIRY